MMRKRLAILIFVLLPGLLMAQGGKNTGIFTDTLKIKKSVRVVGLPIIYYTPETAFGFGGGVQLFLNKKLNVYNSRLSNILTTVIYTTKKQLIIESKPQIYFMNGAFFLDGLFRYKLFPNSFWGIGNNTPESNLESYNMKTIRFQATLLFRLPPSLNFGFEYLYEMNKMIETKEDGLLANGDIPGSEGADISGLSIVFNLDDRDNVYSTRRGNYMQLRAGFSSKVLGANYSYNKYIIDLRHYFPIKEKHVIAAQLYFEENFGDVPFQGMAWLGGGERGRGYYKGRYMDNNMYSVQAEYRWRFLPRWIGAAFFSLADVADLPNNFSNDPKYSFGGGIRFQPLKDNGTLLRLDYGVGRYGQSGIYFGVNEAF
jgi:outer membrane protein assembly factor BamA